MYLALVFGGSSTSFIKSVEEYPMSIIRLGTCKDVVWLHFVCEDRQVWI